MEIQMSNFKTWSHNFAPRPQSISKSSITKPIAGSQSTVHSSGPGINTYLASPPPLKMVSN
jgi:hypothetical protein